MAKSVVWLLRSLVLLMLLIIFSACPNNINISGGSSISSSQGGSSSSGFSPVVGVYAWTMDTPEEINTFSPDNGNSTMSLDMVNFVQGTGSLLLGPSTMPISGSGQESKLKIELYPGTSPNLLDIWTNHTKIKLNVYIPTNCNIDTAFVGMFTSYPSYYWIGGTTQTSPSSLHVGWNEVLFDLGNCSDAYKLTNATVDGVINAFYPGEHLQIIFTFFSKGDGSLPHSQAPNMAINIDGIAFTN